MTYLFGLKAKTNQNFVLWLAMNTTNSHHRAREFQKKKKFQLKKSTTESFKKKKRKRKKDLYDIQSKHKFSSKLPLCVY